ncbi:MAG: SAM-dependent chlorinase/fluorinase [Myxococcales bacterium]|nr:SAM-dependent chlorinase/fluorinase [Myxococcales bacterium]
MNPAGIITLLTDFGTKDPFVGVMHAVILSRFPAARVVDLSHGVAPQAVEEAAFWLERCFRRFPAGTIHVAVVDPGVGTSRAALVVEALGHGFVGPDNGLLGAISGLPAASVREIDLGQVGLPEPSRTFHGRDVFAPVAAELAAGRLKFSDVGPARVARTLADASPRAGSDGVTGRVVSVDHFGNLITNLEATDLARFSRPVVRVGVREVPVLGTYAEVSEAEPVAVVSSFDTLEVSLRNGRAADFFGVGRGAEVSLRQAR